MVSNGTLQNLPMTNEQATEESRTAADIQDEHRIKEMLVLSHITSMNEPLQSANTGGTASRIDEDTHQMLGHHPTIPCAKYETTRTKDGKSRQEISTQNNTATIIHNDFDAHNPYKMNPNVHITINENLENNLNAEAIDAQNQQQQIIHDALYQSNTLLN